MKKIIFTICLLLFIGITSFCIYTYIYNESHVAILGYHKVLPKKLNTIEDEFTIDLEKLEEQLKYLQKHHYHSMTLEEFYCWKKKECKKEHKSVLITFDDGFQNNYDYAFALLAKYHMNAVVFYIGDKYQNEKFMSLETIQNTLKEYPNIEFASHSYKLHNRKKKNYEKIVSDIKEMKNLAGSLIQTNYFAYPYGDYDEEYKKALKDDGVKMAFTFGPGKNHRKSSQNDDDYEIPRLNISRDLSMTKFKIRLFFPF